MVDPEAADLETSNLELLELTALAAEAEAQKDHIQELRLQAEVLVDLADPVQLF
jgi:hypothetical protein